MDEVHFEIQQIINFVGEPKTEGFCSLEFSFLCIVIGFWVSF
jgi:hypothetical protein